MRSTRQSALVHGVVGGLLAGGIVALWFLAVDIIAGDPLLTPARLGANLFGQPAVSRGVLVFLYTLLHFGAFAIFGGVTGWLLAATATSPGILLGLFLGASVLDAIHYFGLLVTDQRLLNVLPWAHVVGANMLAGVAFMLYMHRVEHEESPLGIGVLRDHPLVAEGLKIGAIGAAAVAVWFFLIDIAGGVPFHTPAALGSVMFLGASDADAVSAAPGVIAAYSVVHLGLFGAAGIVFVAIARRIEELPTLAYMALLAAILLEAATFTVLVSLGEAVLGTISLWSVGIGNLLAVGSMAWWIWKTHPMLRERVRAEGFAANP